MIKFCSLDYFKAVQETANEDEEFISRARDFDATFTFKVTDRLDELQFHVIIGVQVIGGIAIDVHG